MKIDVYTSTNCPNCDTVKKHLTKIGAEYSEIPLSSDNIAKISQYTRSAPAIFVDGEYIPTSAVMAM
jgi:glutaredoxin